MLITIFLLLLLLGWIRESARDDDNATTKESTIDANNKSNNKDNINFQIKSFFF